MKHDAIKAIKHSYVSGKPEASGRGNMCTAFSSSVSELGFSQFTSLHTDLVFIFWWFEYNFQPYSQKMFLES